MEEGNALVLLVFHPTPEKFFPMEKKCHFFPYEPPYPGVGENYSDLAGAFPRGGIIRGELFGYRGIIRGWFMLGQGGVGGGKSSTVGVGTPVPTMEPRNNQKMGW